MMNSALPRVLAVDDEPDIRNLIEYGLGNLGFEVKTVADGRSATDIIRNWEPEAIILDIVMPGIDGFSLITSLRRVTNVPILMVTGKKETADMVTALGTGADDYISKPFHLDELAARIHALLRRPRMEVREIVSYSDIAIDVSHRTVSRAGKAIELSAREFDLLLTLARRPEQVFTRSQLLDLVWGTDRDVTQATVETYISYLRAKVDSIGAFRLIQTLRGVGYTLRAEPSSANKASA